MKARRSASLVALVSLLSACSSDDESAAGKPAFSGANDGLAASCHPFRTPGACGTPFPSSVWLEEDSATRTGVRLALPSEIVSPSASTEEPFDPAAWNRIDGFSPATPIIAYFAEKLDDQSLPSQADFTQSLSPAAATLLLDLETGELVAHMSELDLSADIAESERQPLIIRPAAHLRPSHHYAVAVTKSLKTKDGGTPARAPGFESALAGATSDDPVVQKALAALPDVLAAFESAGVARDDLLLAWDFRTGSLEQITENVLAMRDDVLPKLDALSFSVDTDEQNTHNEIQRRVRGSFEVPSFLSNDDRSVAPSELVLGDDGLPEEQRITGYDYELIIPTSATTNGPYPLLVYGHGLLGDADEISGSHVRGFCNSKGWICIGTDWIGLSESEATGIGASAAAVEAVKDVNKFPWVGDRLQQALVNFMALVRVAPKIVEQVEPGVLDTSVPAQYYGISQGGIMGMPLIAYSPDLPRGVLQVGGSAYSLMIQRSTNWNQFFPAIRNAYPDRIDQQVLMALWQSMFDKSEGSGTAWAQGVHPPLPGVPDKQVLMQIAVGDSQVANLAAEIQARTLGLPNLTPTAKDVWGLEGAQSGAPQAIVFWDLVRDPPPLTNETPLEDNDVHGDIRKLPENQTQTDVFLKTGVVENTCNGPCAFPGFQP